MDELLGRRTPHSAEAEQAVLGSIFIDPNCLADVLSIIRPADFYVQTAREIFETIFTMFSYSQTIDPVTALDQMRVRGVYREGVSQEYILEVMQVTPTAANVLEYAAIVRDRSLLRNLGAAASDITNMVYEGAGEAEAMLEAAERKIYALRQGRTVGGLTPISQVMQDVYANLSEAAARDSIPGLTSGLVDLDNRILGLNKGDLILVASRPGMGKTSIALNIALHVGKTTDKTVAVFSLEMAKEQLAMRLLSGEGHINGKKLMTGRLSQEEWSRVGAAAAVISATDLRIEDNPSLTVTDMSAQCRRIKNLGLIVIDYLQLMQSAGKGYNNAGENRTQVVSDISRMLKIMAKELNVPVICLSQLSRANVTRQNKKPVLSDLRESGAIEQDADIVIGLYRDDYFNEECENPNAAEAIILKNRHGETGTIDLVWIPEFTTYVSADKRRSDEDE